MLKLTPGLSEKPSLAPFLPLVTSPGPQDALVLASATSGTRNLSSAR